MNAFPPRGRGVGPRGVSRQELKRDDTDGWELRSATFDAEARLPRWIGDARPTWYQFQRRA